jgi:hypothetical protein
VNTPLITRKTPFMLRAAPRVCKMLAHHTHTHCTATLLRTTLLESRIAERRNMNNRQGTTRRRTPRRRTPVSWLLLMKYNTTRDKLSWSITSANIAHALSSCKSYELMCAQRTHTIHMNRSHFSCQRFLIHGFSHTNIRWAVLPHLRCMPPMLPWLN